MLLTDDFAYIHLPKTGGTFVASILRQVYGPGRLLEEQKHATASEIPASHASLPIISSLRNPYERYVSQYRFAWWKLHPDHYCGEAAMRRAFPSYPELSFGEFLELANTRFVNCFRGQPTGYANGNLQGEEALGWHTEQYIRFFARRPLDTFRRLDRGALTSRSYVAELFPVHFLATERLNAELYDLLLGLGHEPAAIAFVRDAAPVNPPEGGRSSEDHWQRYYTAETLAFVRKRERLIFDLHPSFDRPAAEILAAEGRG